MTAPTSGKMVFEDTFASFNGNPIGTKGWQTALPFGGIAHRALPWNNEACYYGDTSSGTDTHYLNATAGKLYLMASKASALHPNPYWQGAYCAELSKVLALPYNSAALNSLSSFNMTFGYFEVSAQIPAGAGMWPGFWLFSATGKSTDKQEIDILESIGGLGQYFTSTHGAASGLTSVQNSTGINLASGLHRYGVDWRPDGLAFYFDGNIISQQPTPPGFTVPMCFVFNLAVGGPGSWPGEPNAQTPFPAYFAVDYVRAWATPSTTQVGGTLAL